MRLSGLGETRLPIIVVFGLLGVACSSWPEKSPPKPDVAANAPVCDDSEAAGLTLPAGFCATIFADNIGHARHLSVSPSGVVYVNTWSGKYYPPNDVPPAGGFLVALKDQHGAGKADLIERFGEPFSNGAAGGLGIGLYKDWIYAEEKDRIIRYSLPAGQLVPQGQAETILSGMPLTGDHPMHAFIIGEDGLLYVASASASNSCQVKNRALKSPGVDPCTELATRAGIWRYDANKAGQKFSAAERYATGIRNAEGFAFDAAGHRLFVTQHGRDALHSMWPALYQPEQEATLPSEELLLLQQGGDYGWPQCYYDPVRRKLVLAPEYGGDGGKTAGLCAKKIGPFAAFPAHWAPLAMAFYNAKQFPSRYRNGVFIAFHGSWNRAPYQQRGYNVVFQSLASGPNAGRCEVFADGFAGAEKSPDQASHRPSGVAVGPDGSLFVADDVTGRIYKIVYRGDARQAGAGTKFTSCPGPRDEAGPVTQANNRPPVGADPDDNGNLPVPAGATREMVALGSRIYQGAGGAACVGCHSAKATGTPLGPDLTDKTWLWSDGSFAGIQKSINDGVPVPKQYRSAMPGMGGAQLTPDQIAALAAYVWALSHP